MSALLLILGLVPVATLVAALLWPKSTWGKRLLPPEKAAPPYRELALVRWTSSREPRLVRVTAALTAFLGGMAFPGGFAGVVGIVAAVGMISKPVLDPSVALVVGLAASVPTGLVIAIQCFRLFGPILDNRAGVTQRMRALARLSVVHNLVVASMWVAYLAAGGEPWAALFAIYPLVSFTHALLLRSAATAMDRQAEEASRCEQALAAASSSVRVEELPSRKRDGLSVATEPAPSSARVRA